MVSTQTLDIYRSPARKTIRFRFTPRDVGSLLLAVETPVQRGEMVESNNRVEVPLEVRRNKIRMLTISGTPSWNAGVILGGPQKDERYEIDRRISFERSRIVRFFADL